MSELDLPREKHRTDEQRADIERAWGLTRIVGNDHLLHSTEGHLAVLRGITLGRRLQAQELMRLFEDHYWDSLDKNLALAHIRAVFGMSQGVPGLEQERP